MFKRISIALVGVGSLAGISSAHAVIDVTAATSAVADGGIAAVAIATAFLAAYGLVVGIKMAVRAVRGG